MSFLLLTVEVSLLEYFIQHPLAPQALLDTTENLQLICNQPSPTNSQSLTSPPVRPGGPGSGYSE